jgi:hypothetical protein
VTTKSDTQAPFEVDGDRVDKLVEQIRDTFRDPRQPEPHDNGDPWRLDRRDWRDFVLSDMAERWQADDGDSPLWDAVQTLVSPAHEMDKWGMREAIISLTNALNRATAEGDVVSMTDLRNLRAARRALNAAIDRWEDEAE